MLLINKHCYGLYEFCHACIQTEVPRYSVLVCTLLSAPLVQNVTRQFVVLMLLILGAYKDGENYH